MFKLIFTSIPIFIKEYIKKPEVSLSELKYFSEEVLRILNESVYTESSEGYRTIYKTNVANIDDTKKFIIDEFFIFYLSKSDSSIYNEELNIGDYITNEVFEVIYEDEFGDTEIIRLAIKDYNNLNYDISFMRV